MQQKYVTSKITSTIAETERTYIGSLERGMPGILFRQGQQVNSYSTLFKGSNQACNSQQL